jgi:2-polyprenyl-3-methyl-5-hydroxy-6-metoxy-1,4-benzoquinol methylase
MSMPSWGISASRYEQMYADAAKALGVDVVASPVVPLVEPGEHVLDLGCATGWQARLLVERGCTVVGVEVDAEAAVRAMAWCERVVVCDLDLADLADELEHERFDVVAAGDVLEHLRDPVRVLHSVASLLRPDGRIVASVPNVAHGSVRLALLGGTFDYADAGLLDRTHLRFFTATTVRELFTSAGWTIERLDRIEVPIDQGVPYDTRALPAGIEALVAAMPEATSFQFVVVARPDRSRTAAPEPSTEHDTISKTSTGTSLDRAQARALRERDETVAELRRTVTTLERQLDARQDNAFSRALSRLRAHRRR